MSSKQQLPPHSNASSSSKPVTHRPLKQTLLVSKVPVGPTDEALLRDLQKSCVGVLNVTRLQDRNGRPVGAILVHFTSQVVADRVFAQGHVFLMGERREVRLHFVPFCDHCQVEGHIVARCPHLDPDDGRSEEAERRPVDSPRVPLECYRCHQEGHRAAQCPHRPLTESRLMHLFQQQQRQIEEMIAAFEHRWTERLEKETLAKSSSSVNRDRMMPICRDVTAVCQQLNQHTVTMAKQLASVVAQLQIEAKHEAGTTPTMQNGH